MRRTRQQKSKIRFYVACKRRPSRRVRRKRVSSRIALDSTAHSSLARQRIEEAKQKIGYDPRSPLHFQEKMASIERQSKEKALEWSRKKKGFFSGLFGTKISLYGASKRRTSRRLRRKRV